MSIADPNFLEAFVKQCSAQGMSEAQTTEAVWLQGRNEFLLDPRVQHGFASVMADYQGPLTKAALAKYFTPNVIACVVECQLRLGDSALAESFRKEAGLFDQPQRYVAPSLLDKFNGLSLPQKALVSALMGGGATGAYRYFHPSEEDQMTGRGDIERGIRGAGQGAITGIGALAGGELGQRLAPAVGASRGLGFSGGAVMGALAGNNLMR